MVVHAWSPITLEAIIWISNSEVAWILNIETLSQKKLNNNKKRINENNTCKLFKHGLP